MIFVIISGFSKILTHNKLKTNKKKLKKIMDMKEILWLLGFITDGFFFRLKVYLSQNFILKEA